MNLLKKIEINKKNISLFLCFLTISAYIVVGNCLTYNIGNRMPIKVAEIIALLSCCILLLMYKKEIMIIDKENIKVVLWFAVASIPMIFYNYTMRQIMYGLLYSIRAIATIGVSIVVTNVLKKYKISRDNIFNYIIDNYLIVVAIGIIQLIFFSEALNFYNVFYRLGIYYPNPDPHIGRLVSTYFDPNFLSACLIIPLILSLDFYSKTGKYHYLIKTIIFIVTIILTVSRSGVLGVCIALFVYGISNIKTKDKKIILDKSLLKNRATIVILSTGFIFVFLACFTNVRVFKRIFASVDDPSTYARIEDWTRASNNSQDEETDTDDNNIKIGNNRALKTIFGIGYNMIGFSDFNEDKGQSSIFGNDSSLILIYISSGIIGTAYFAYFVINRLIKSYKSRFEFKNNISMIAIVITSLIICNFNNLLFYILWLFPIFVLLNLNEKENFNNNNTNLLLKDKNIKNV